MLISNRNIFEKILRIELENTTTITAFVFNSFLNKSNILNLAWEISVRFSSVKTFFIYIKNLQAAKLKALLFFIINILLLPVPLNLLIYNVRLFKFLKVL